MATHPESSRQSVPRRHRYGSHPEQWADLYLPEGNDHRGIVVVIHGGYWRDRYTAELGVPAAQDLARHGFAVWNLEYRRAGTDGAPGAGGWPATFEDVAAGIDLLADLAAPSDPERIVALGHSAGGHLGVWAAGRHALPPGAPGAGPRVRLSAVVSQAGVLDLLAAERRSLGDGAAVNFMGGTSEQLPEAFALADPLRAVPIGVPVHAVHSREDEAVPFDLSVDYVATARKAGDPAELHETTGGHFDLIEPDKPAYRVCRELLEDLLP